MGAVKMFALPCLKKTGVLVSTLTHDIMVKNSIYTHYIILASRGGGVAIVPMDFKKGILLGVPHSSCWGPFGGFEKVY